MKADGTIVAPDGSATETGEIRAATFPVRFDRKLRIRVMFEPDEQGRFELEMRYSAPGESKAGGSLLFTIDRDAGRPDLVFDLDTRANEFPKPGVYRFSVLRLPTRQVLARIPVTVVREA